MKLLKSFQDFISESALAIPSGKEADSIQKLTTILSGSVGKKETPDNSGPMVKDFLSRVGLDEGQPWCMAFVYAAFDDLSKTLGIQNPLPKTALVMGHWNSADKTLKIEKSAAQANPSLIKPGMIFFKTRPGSGTGHTGIVLAVDANAKSFMTIDGNSSDMVKVNQYSLNMPELIGFIDYFKDIRDKQSQTVSPGLNVSTGLETALASMAQIVQTHAGSQASGPSGKED